MSGRGSRWAVALTPVGHPSSQHGEQPDEDMLSMGSLDGAGIQGISNPDACSINLPWAGGCRGAYSGIEASATRAAKTIGFTCTGVAHVGPSNHSASELTQECQHPNLSSGAHGANCRVGPRVVVLWALDPAVTLQLGCTAGERSPQVANPLFYPPGESSCRPRAFRQQAAEACSSHDSPNPEQWYGVDAVAPAKAQAKLPTVVGTKDYLRSRDLQSRRSRRERRHWYPMRLIVGLVAGACSARPLRTHSSCCGTCLL